MCWQAGLDRTSTHTPYQQIIKPEQGHTKRKNPNPTTERCRICASSLVRELPPLDVLDCSLRRVVDVVPFLYEGCHTGRTKLRILEPCLSVCLRCRWLLLVIIVVVQACSRSLRRHGERTAVLLPKAVLQQPEITIPATHAASG